MQLPANTTTVLTCDEMNEVLGKRWTFVSVAEKRAIHRERLARMRAEREQRQEQRR